MSEPSPDVTVFHLVWAPLGTGPLGEFLASYRANPAGMPHRLRILFNGFDPGADLAPYTALLDGLEFEAQVLPRPVQDLAAYYQGAEAVATPFVCFLNSYSRLREPGWLAMLHRHARRESVGIVGATGSYESVTDVWRRLRDRSGEWRPTLARSLLDLARGRVSLEGHPYLGWAPFWRDFPLFPNPHIRTNGFMIRRRAWLGLRRGPLEVKQDAYRFESGRRGLTRQLRRRGLEPLVVGRDGRAYRIGEWQASRTFRSDDSSNLLISDNRTREFDALDAEGRRFLMAIAWGERRAMAAGHPPSPGADAGRGRALGVAGAPIRS
jgi:hypothetical protein